MKKIFLFLIIISFWACDDDTKDDTKDVALNQTEIDDLKFMREEEKLAYDVYSYAFDKYNIDIFSNIANSELQHTTKVLSLIEKFDIEDPVGDNGRGIYSNSDFTDLYVALTAEVDKSINDAYQVGALIEDLDIKDLDEVMERTSNQDIINVYENLRKIVF